VEVVPGQLDARLNLAPCQKVDVFMPAGQRAWGRTRIGLKCLQGPVAWSVTLPLTVRLWAPALVATGPLPAGTVLAASHLRMSEVDWAERDSPVLFLEGAALGRTLGTALSPGAPVRQEHLRKRQWFDAGDNVRIRAVGPGFTIQSDGVAVSPGIEGQNVQIRTESGRTIIGKPVGQRLAEVLL
jgi:flagella basal body P-ring formation protein FlgA